MWTCIVLELASTYFRVQACLRLCLLHATFVYSHLESDLSATLRCGTALWDEDGSWETCLNNRRAVLLSVYACGTLAEDINNWL